MEPINNSKNKLNSEIIYNFHCFPNTHNTRLDLASSVSVFFFFFEVHFSDLGTVQ